MQSKSAAAAQTQPCDAAPTRSLYRQRGSGRLKAIFWLAVLVSMIYVGIKVIPILVNEYEFQDAMQNTARFASVNRQSEADIKKAVVDEAEKDQIPVRPEDIQVQGRNGNVQVEAAYSVTVDLSVYKWTLNFHPSVRNDALF